MDITLGTRHAGLGLARSDMEGLIQPVTLHATAWVRGLDAWLIVMRKTRMPEAVARQEEEIARSELGRWRRVRRRFPWLVVIGCRRDGRGRSLLLLGG